MRQNQIVKIILLTLGTTGIAFADTGVMATASTGVSVVGGSSNNSSTNSPYSVLSSSTGQPQGMSTQTAANPAASAVAAPAPTPVIAAPVASTAPAIQYVQPAAQVGKTSGAASGNTKNVSAQQAAKGSAAQPSLQSASTALGDYASAPQNSQGTGMLGPGALAPSQMNYLLSEIVTNTGAIQKNSKGLQQLVDYWTTTSSDDQVLKEVSGYGALSNLNSQTTANSQIEANYRAMQKTDVLNSLANLTGNWTQSEGAPASQGINDAIPYLNNLTGGLNDHSIDSAYWVPAVNRSLFDLSTNQQNIQSLEKAVLAPFGGNSDWVSSVQQATTPELLKMLLVEQAVNNAMAYQILQRENDQTLMQASELRVLNEINVSIQNTSAAQVHQETRIIDAINNQNSQ